MVETKIQLIKYIDLYLMTEISHIKKSVFCTIKYFKY